MGISTNKFARNYAFTGVQLRSTGVKWDLRKNIPYEIYPLLKFSVPIAKQGDCYDRYLLRIEELTQSNNLIFQAINKLPLGPIQTLYFVLQPPSKIDVKTTIQALIWHFCFFSNKL